MDTNLNILGIKIKGKSPAVFVLVIPLLVIAYFMSCVLLYSVVNFFDILEFTWMNGLYLMIVYAAAKGIFSGGE